MVRLFEGIKIIDLTRVFSGPFATRHFADFGADVIKIEPPGGDDTRYFPPIKNGWSGYFELLNRNKKSFFLDLKNPNDLNSLYGMIRDSDVFVENFSPDVKKNLKISWHDIKNINPRIIYASLFGVAKNDNIKYYDVIAQAESGLISLNGEGTDMKISTAIVDAFAGIKLAFAISSALLYREKHKKGLRINISMKGTGFDLLEQNLIQSSIENKNPEKVGNMDNAIAPFGIFKCADGSIALACGNEKLWGLLSEYLSRSGFINDPNLYSTNILRVKNIQKLKMSIESVLSKINRKTLTSDLKKIGVPCAQVATMLDILNDQDNYTNGFLLRENHNKLGDVVYPQGGIEFEDG